MFSQSLLLDVDLWEAWIEYDEFDPVNFGTLYIIGEIMIEPGRSGPFIQKLQTSSGTRLILGVPETPAGKARRKEVLYSEPVRNLNQYSSILIYSGDTLIAGFEDIEILI